MKYSFLDKILNKFVLGIQSVVDKFVNVPYNNKKFNLEHYDLIHEHLGSLNTFAVLLNSVDGNGSNLLIKFTNLFYDDKRKRGSKITHAAAYIGMRAGNQSRILEAVGKGIRERSLKMATVQKDNVKIRIPDARIFPMAAQQHALNFLNLTLDSDELKNIEYDFLHDVKDPSKMDCSEAIYHAIKYGFEKADIYCPLKTTRRFGRDTFAPADLEFSELFIDWYDNRKGGFLSGR